MLTYILLSIISFVFWKLYILIRKNREQTKVFFKQLKRVLTRTLFYNAE